MRTIVISPATRFGSTYEMPPQDVFTWRKYGRKEIFGSKYPRNNFRCSDKVFCQAMKQVQQLRDNPNVFEVIYYGGHSCIRPLIRPAPQLVNISKDMTTTTAPSPTAYYEWLSSGTPIKSINSIPEAKLAAPADGGHHPMMDKVAGYLVSVIRSQQMNVENGDGAFSFLAETESIMEMLESIFALKSKKHADPSLRNFFMMNNWRYIEMANKRRKLDTASFGNVCWFQKNRAKVQEKLELYQKSSWDKVLEFLKLDISDSMENSLAADLMKEKLRLFNMHFTETCRVQCIWSVHDEELRRKIIASLKNILLPAYGIFIGKFQDIVKSNAYEYIEYGMFDIHDLLDILFLGSKTDK